MVDAITPPPLGVRTTAYNPARPAPALRLTDQDGQPLRIIDLPMPNPLVVEGLRLPASYANFLIANSVVLVPTYRSPKQDAEAIEILQSLFPTRRVVGIDCTALVWGLGSIHCVTQQQPMVGRLP